MSTLTTWVPINDHPGDQRLDRLPTHPDTPETSYFAEIGPNGDDRWSWTIIAVTDHGSDDIATGTTTTENDAKTAAETWTPAPTLDPLDRYTVSTTPDGREALPVITEGTNTGWTPMTRPDGTIRIGYLNPDGTVPDMRDTEYAWVNPATLTATRRLP